MTTANSTPPAAGLRLRRLSIKNYKKIDTLELEFPSPLMAGDMDVLVLGSKNGGGKTSVLECCSLLFLVWGCGEIFPGPGVLLPGASLAIKAGCQQSVIDGVFEIEKNLITVSLPIQRDGQLCLHVDGNAQCVKFPYFDFKSILLGEPGRALDSVLAWSSEPLIIPYLLHFNSYRRVQKANPNLGMMHEGISADQSNTMPISAFKWEVLRLLMGRAGLFEGFDNAEARIVLTHLNNLVERYCGGRIETLVPLSDNSLDIRIKPKNGGQSFSFDGLSSGQKEMIATLFLIWKNTRNQSAIVLIDEPELHLNTEWHGDFIHQLYKLAPHNQYILATHSEEIFRSVDESRRAILLPDADGDAQ